MADSARALWQLLSGKTVLLPDELILSELNANRDKLHLCLNYFKPLSGPAKADNLKKKLSKLHSNFIQKLAHSLDLEENQSYIIYQLYILRSFTRDKKDIEDILSVDKSSSLLIERIREFYQLERIYLLRCVKYIISSCDHPDHPHYEVYKEYTSSLLEGKSFVDEIKSQYHAICGKVSSLSSLNQQEMKIIGNSLNTVSAFGSIVIHKYLTENLIIKVEKMKQNSFLVASLQREKCELLEILLLCYKHSDFSPESTYEFFTIFKKHGFAGNFGHSNFTDGTDQTLLNRIRFLQTLVLVGGLDLELLIEKFSEPSSEENIRSFMRDDHYKVMDNAVNELTDHQFISPLFLAWTVVRHLKKDPTFAKLGNRALLLDVFSYLHDMLSEMKLCHVDQSIRSLTVNILYGLINSVLCLFHESTLGNTRFLYAISNQLLEDPLISRAFWSLGSDEGMRSLLTLSLELFPVQFERPMMMLTSVIKTGSASLEQVIHLLQNLSVFTDILDYGTALTPVNEENVYKLTSARKPILYPGSQITVFANTLGKVLNEPIIDGSKINSDLVCWLVPYDGFDILLEEVSNLLQNLDSCSGNIGDSVRRVTLVMNFVGEALRVSTSIVRENINALGGFMDGAMKLLQRFSSSTINPPINLLGSCMLLLHHSMSLIPQEVWRGIQMTGFMPHFSCYVKDLNEATRALNSGSYGKVLVSCESVEGVYPVTEAFLEFVNLCIDFPGVHEFKAGMTAPVLFICQEIFTTYDKWKYSPGYSSEKIGLLCLKIFQKVLNVKEMNTRSFLAAPEKKASNMPDTLRLSPEVVVMNSMLFSEAGNTLLGIIQTGVEEVEAKLAEQNSALCGPGSSLIELVNGSLCILNQLLTKEPSMASSSTYLGKALSTSPIMAGQPYQQPLLEPLGKPPQSSHLIKSIVMYINHKEDCNLTIQATLLLKNLAKTFPISMLACLGSDVFIMKEMYLERLQAVADDVNLKVAILDWLTVCIQNQPGLVEIFINDEKNKLSSLDNQPMCDIFSNVKSPETNVAMQSKCLDVVAVLIQEEKQGTYECPLELLSASFELVHNLWKEYHMTSMVYLKKLKTFWRSLFNVLNVENMKKKQGGSKASDIQIKCISHVLRIVALEIFHSDRNGNECKEFVDKMNSIIQGEDILRWSEFIQEVLLDTESISTTSSEILLLAWRDFLVVLASLKKKNTRTSLIELENKKETIINDLLKVLGALLTTPSANLKTASIVSSMVVILINRWHGSLENARRLVESSCETMESLLLSPSIQKFDSLLLPIIGSLVIIFKECKSHFLPHSQSVQLIKRLMDVICRLLQSSLLYREGRGSISHSEDKKMRLFENSSKLKLLPISAIHLLTEILSIFPASFSARKPNLSSSFSIVPNSPPTSSNQQTPPSPPTLVRVQPPSTDFIFHILGQYSVIQCLISWCTYSLMTREDLDLVQTILTYFIKLAQTEKGAEMLFACAVNDQLGLYLHNLYVNYGQVSSITKQKENNSTSVLQEQHQEERISIYLLFTRLTCQLLVTLKAFYLDKALEYLGSHRERFHGILENLAVFMFSPSKNDQRSLRVSKGNNGVSSGRPPGADSCGTNLGVYELEVSCHFINELAKYNSTWKVRMPDLLQTVMTRLCVWTQMSAGLLLLPRFMQSVIQSKRSSHHGDTSGDSTPRPKGALTSDDSISNTLELVKVQQRILSLIAINMNTMKRFSIPLEDIIYQRLEDLPCNDSFILIDFSNPSIDESSMPTFGMLISVFNFCIDLLSKADGPRSVSPHKPSTPRPVIPANSLNKSLIMFTMDQVLYLMMSHACYRLKDQKVSSHEKQILKTYLNNELSSCLNAIHRHFRTSSPSPLSARRSPVGTPAPLKFNREHQFFGLADLFTKQVLK